MSVGGALGQAASISGLYANFGGTNPQGIQYVYNGVAASIVGGSVSKLAGGSFESGAIAGLYGRMFNDMVKMKINGKERLVHHSYVNDYVLGGSNPAPQSCAVYQVMCVTAGVLYGDTHASEQAGKIITAVDAGELASQGIKVMGKGTFKFATDFMIENAPFVKNAINTMKNISNAGHFKKYCTAQCTDGVIKH